MTSPLFTPYALGNLTLPNRIVIAPMCQYSAKDGVVGDWHLMHLGNLSHSGAGLLIAEATAVSPEGRISDRCPGLWDDATESGWTRVLEGVRRYSAMPVGIQLAHAGRKGGCAAPWLGGKQLAADQGGWQNVAPSALPFDPSDAAPQALDSAGIKRLVQAFADAARRADRAGFDVVELHAAHGYLMHEFLSLVTNQRSDEYGGSLANRLRFVLEVFDAVRAVWPVRKALGMRVSATDWVEGGWTPEETVELAKELKARGADFIHVSSGGLSLEQQIKVGPGYQLPFARLVKEATGLTTIGVGLITEAKQAEAVVTDGDADLVGVARVMLFDPRWPWRAAAELGAQVQAPPQFWRGAPRGSEGVFAPLP
jgi:2,4-dienoyl-CoA reductase-like NADH-dependent reductase (Old Yellow Enzyme family)